MDAIKIEDLWVSYRVRGKRASTLKNVVGTLGRSLSARKWALQGIGLSVERGSMYGLIGINGSGKSTLLRCMAGIFRPTRGEVAVTGRTGSLIDLTAGFDMELTARDNVFLSGAIYGVPRAQIADKLDEIFDFAGLEEHVDRPMRSFSTGMGMRLGFALVVAIEPEIVLVDEVLAVGDESFKHKCLEKMRELLEGGTTVVFASHELALIESLCDRVAVLEGGELVGESDGEGAVSLYCDRLGIDREEALTRTPLEALRTDRPWSRHRR